VRRRDAAPDENNRAKKNGRFGEEAAKFREETPKKGGGFAGGPAIPRCNNMMERDPVRKAQTIRKTRNFPSKISNLSSPRANFEAFGRNYGNCAAQ
jgi:hypothetical protein